jgi:predicted negative regulator of RcsB-dependent stress response
MSEPSKTAGHNQAIEETIIEWFRTHGRVVAIIGAVLVIGAGAYWFRLRSIDIKNLNAQTALNTAIQSLQAGNQALATSDLQRVVSRYGDTQDGIEAGLLMAQMDYNNGKVPDGITVLQSLLGQASAQLDLASIYGMIGDGQLQADKPADAAQSYQQAADAAKSDEDRSLQLSKEARAMVLAGDTASAASIWKKLAADPKAQGVAAEAKVRLGELEAQPVTKG